MTSPPTASLVSAVEGKERPITANVLRRGPARFDMVGQRLPDSLHDTDQVISNGTVKRLHRYALRAMADAGFNVSGWACEVYTMDGDDSPADRSYCVEFTNAKGGMLGVQGILTQNGHPCLDHGLCIDRDRTLPASHTPVSSDTSNAEGERA